jgi:sterol desaturase/sphingolipid hydroxylase (fatty acid hydroxylase superfamily)
LDLSPGISYFFGQLGKAFLAPGSQVSLASLFIAILVLAVRRYKKGRRLRLRLLVRALFPKRIVLSRSSFADLGYFYFNLFVFGLVLGWAVLSYDAITRAVVDLLAAVFGPVQPTSLPIFVSRTIITVMLFLAYEARLLAQSLFVPSDTVPLGIPQSSPLGDGIDAVDELSRPPGLHVHILQYSRRLYRAGERPRRLPARPELPQYGLSETNIILVFFIYFYVHLQHTQLWISFTGWLGHLFMSPAHHQIHHSRNPAHFNKNLGSCLAVWDWIFGTLYIPSRHSEKLEFGVEPDHEHAHTIRGELIAPFGRAAGLLKECFVRSPPPAPLAAADRKQAH